MTKRLLFTIGAWGLAVAAAAVLWVAADIFLLTFVGLLLAVFLRALAGRVSRRLPLSKGKALAVVLVGLALLLGLAAWLVAPALVRQVAQLAETLPDALGKVQQRLTRTDLGQQLLDQLPSLEALSSGLLQRAPGAFTMALSAGAYLLFVVFASLFFAVNPGLYKSGVVSLVPPRRRNRARDVIGAVVAALRAWLVGRVVAMVIVGIVTGVGLWLIGVPLALGLGFLAGLLEFIPYVGPTLAAAPAVLLAFTQAPEMGLYALLLYVAIQQFEGDLLTPVIQERTVDLPPVLTLVATFVMGLLFGFLGLLVATPLAAVGLVLVRMLYREDVLGDTVTLPGRFSSRSSDASKREDEKAAQRGNATGVSHEG